MRPTIRLGRIAGVDVGIHWSLLVIGAVFVASLVGGQLPHEVPDADGRPRGRRWPSSSSSSILAHELADSIVARRQGQTVNGITLWLLGGVSERAPRPPTWATSSASRSPDRPRASGSASSSPRWPSASTRCCPPAGCSRRWRGGSRSSTSRWGSSTCFPARRLTAAGYSPHCSGSAGAIVATRTRSAARAGCVVGTLLVVGSVVLLFTGTDALLDRTRRFVRAQRVRVGRGEPRPRLGAVLADQPVGVVDAPDFGPRCPSGPQSPTSDPLPSRRSSPGGTAPPPRSCLLARYSPSHPKREARCSSARSRCRSPGSRVVRGRYAPCRRSWERGLPVVVDDADGRPVGIFGLDELKVAASGHPVLARSAR